MRWNLPISMIVFLENISKLNDTGKVVPWIQLRKMIFDIYEDFVKNTWEIQGSCNTTTVYFDEYVCLYFLKFYKNRKQAEQKLFEFLIGLRYYLQK